MSSSDEAYYTFGSPPENPPEQSPKQSPEHSPENSSGKLPAEHAEPHAGDINPVNVPNTVYEYTRLQGDQRLGSPPDHDPRLYPVYNLKFDSAAPGTYPTTMIFKWSPIPDSPFPGPENAETTPASPTCLMEASLFFDKNGLALPDDNTARFGLWIAHEPRTQKMIPQGSWVFFPLIGAKSGWLSDSSEESLN